VRKVTSEKVMTHAAALFQLAADLGLSRPRLRRDGTVVVHSNQARLPGHDSSVGDRYEADQALAAIAQLRSSTSR